MTASPLTAWTRPLAIAYLALGLTLAPPHAAAEEAVAEAAAEEATADTAEAAESVDDAAAAEEESTSEQTPPDGEQAAETSESAESKAEQEPPAEEDSPADDADEAGDKAEEAEAKPATRASRRSRRAAERARRRAEEAKKVRYADFVLDGPLPESPGGSGPFSELALDLRKQIARIDQAAEDEKITGLVLRVRSPAIGRGQRNELREAIARFRATGKPAIADLEVATPAGYLVASACDEVVMPESGFLLLTGVRAEPLFFKGMLAKIGVEADFVHVGEAKGAAEPFTRRRWSEPVKANLTSMLDDLYEQMIDTIAMDRPVTRAAATAAIDRGLMTANEAKEAGLIDRLAYSGALRDTLAERHEGGRVVFVENYGKKKVDTDFGGPAGFFKLMGLIAGGGKKSTGREPKIAIVYATGPIVTGKSEVDPFGESESVGSTTVVEALEDAADDDRVEAIVLRVNSPGGSAVASDLIWNAIQRIEKPVVASMGDVAASGGYYISMGCDRVVAEPTTVTGSIGVVGGKMAVGGMLKKLGVTTDLIARGANSGLFSPIAKFSDTERAALVALMDDTYDQFTAKAAEGRGMPQERVKELGGGKVYTGRQAKQNGLVDALGDLRFAVTEAKRLAGLDADDKVRIDTYPEAVDFFESLFGDNEEQREVRIDLSLGGALPELDEAFRRAATLRRVFAREPVGLMLPFDLRIE
ncbi:MAG: signal peptide peptidase SppA [Planctomycetota bacterium]